jgi:metal-sulfur cluster biosynthetic enzyme
MAAATARPFPRAGAHRGRPITRTVVLMSTTDATLNSAWDALRMVLDPELGLDIVTLSLVYDLERDGDTLRVTYTLTTPGCPMERVITQGIREALALVEGVARVDTRLVWEPEWHAGMIAPGAW